MCLFLCAHKKWMKITWNWRPPNTECSWLVCSLQSLDIWRLWNHLNWLVLHRGVWRSSNHLLRAELNYWTVLQKSAACGKWSSYLWCSWLWFSFVWDCVAATPALVSWAPTLNISLQYLMFQRMCKSFSQQGCITKSQVISTCIRWWRRC